MAFFTPFAFRKPKVIGEIPYDQPNVVQSGLVFWVDANNPNIFVNSSTIKNIKDVTHTGTLNNVSFVSGNPSYFFFDDATMNNIIFSSISELEVTTEFTIMIEMNTTTGEDDNATMIAKTAASAGTTTNWSSDFAGNGTLRSFYYNGTTPVIVNANNKADIVNQFGMLAVTFKNGDYNIYTNNTLRGNVTSGLTSVNSSTNPLYIGSRGNVQKFNGKISQVMIYNRELTEAELIQNFYAVRGVEDTDAAAFLGAAGIMDSTIEGAIDTLVTDLKGYGIWSKMKAIYPFVGGTATTHKYNLKDPRDLDAAFRLTFVGGLTHSSTGVEGNGSTGYYNTNLDWATHLSQNNAGLYAYLTENLAEDTVNMGAVQQTPFTSIQLGVRNSSGNWIVRVNSDISAQSFSISDSRGFVGVSRLSSTTMIASQNTTQTSFTESSLSLPSGYDIFGLAFNTYGSPGFYSSNTHAFSAVGQGLTDTELDNYYTAVQAFQTTLGRNV